MTWRGGNALRHRVMLPIIGVAIVLAAWEATVVGYPNRGNPNEMRAERITVDGKTVELR